MNNDPLAPYRRFKPTADEPLSFWVTLAVTEFTGAIGRQMLAEKCSQAELAKRLGIKPSVVSRTLKGRQNLTIESMSKYADAIGAAVHVVVVPKGKDWKLTVDPDP